MPRTPSAARRPRGLAKMGRPPPKTSSERGRTFRARQREREAALVRSVAALNDEVQQLERSRQLRFESLVRVRHVHGGSLQHTIREYFTLFQDGLKGGTDAQTTMQARFKESYLRYVYDRDAIVGDLCGVQAITDQWRRYTVRHDRFHLELGHIDVLGDDENAVFHLHLKLSVRISRKTFDHVFPSALYDAVLVKKFLHKVVEYDCVARFRFNDEGRITHYGVDINFIDGLRRAGGSLSEVATMLQHSLISPLCTLRDDAATTVEPILEHSEPRQVSFLHEDNAYASTRQSEWESHALVRNYPHQAHRIAI